MNVIFPSKHLIRSRAIDTSGWRGTRRLRAAAGVVLLLMHRRRFVAVRVAVVLATALMIAMYLIPHSLRGSSLNYKALDEGVSPQEAIETGG